MIAMRTRRSRRRFFLAWMASAAAYAGFWFYHAAACGFWSHAPEPAWLTVGLAASLAAAVTLTAGWWLTGKPPGR